MGVNKEALKSPSGALKIICLCLNIIVLIIAHSGFAATSLYETGYEHKDHRWLTIGTLVAYTLILSVIIVGYFLGEQLMIKTEFMFMLIGCILNIALGSLAIQYYQRVLSGSIRDTGLSWGSLAIINGIVMLVDSALIGKKMLKK